MLYLSGIFILLLLSFHYDICGAQRGRDAWYSVILIVFILIAGLRWRIGFDTPNYLDEFYYETPTLSQLSIEDLKMTKPLWILLNSLVLTFFGKFYVLQLIHATFINVLFFKYIKKHSQYIFTCLFFYFLCMYTQQNMEEMKASTSVVICLYANDFILKRKWIKGYSLYLFAALFHASTYVLSLTPLFLFLRLEKRGYIVLLLSFFAGYWLQLRFGEYLTLLDFVDDSISGKINRYAGDEHFSSQEGNINFYIVKIFPTLFYGIYCLYIVREKSLNKELLSLEPFVLIGLVFLIIQMNVHVFYRFVHFYSIYFVLFFSEVFVTSGQKNKKISKNFSYVKRMFIFLPFLLLTLYSYKNKYIAYHPYSSIIEKRIERDRELHYNEVNRSGPDKNIY